MRGFRTTCLGTGDGRGIIFGGRARTKRASRCAPLVGLVVTFLPPRVNIMRVVRGRKRSRLCYCRFTMSPGHSICQRRLQFTIKLATQRQHNLCGEFQSSMPNSFLRPLLWLVFSFFATLSAPLLVAQSPEATTRQMFVDIKNSGGPVDRFFDLS